jgi:hypothetical protein
VKGFLKPTKLKILLAPLFAVFFYIVLQLLISEYLNRTFYRGFAGLPCIFGDKKPLPFMIPHATLFSEWQNAIFRRCGQESQLQELFWNIKQYLILVLFVVVPSYITACAILYRKEKGQKKPK